MPPATRNRQSFCFRPPSAPVRAEVVVSGAPSGDSALAGEEVLSGEEAPTEEGALAEEKYDSSLGSTAIGDAPLATAAQPSSRERRRQYRWRRERVLLKEEQGETRGVNNGITVTATRASTAIDDATIITTDTRTVATTLTPQEQHLHAPQVHQPPPPIFLPKRRYIRPFITAKARSAPASHLSRDITIGEHECRPLSAYGFFLKAHFRRLRVAGETMAESSRRAGEVWRGMGAEQRRVLSCCAVVCRYRIAVLAFTRRSYFISRRSPMSHCIVFNDQHYDDIVLERYWETARKLQLLATYNARSIRASVPTRYPSPFHAFIAHRLRNSGSCVSAAVMEAPAREWRENVNGVVDRYTAEYHSAKLADHLRSISGGGGRGESNNESNSGSDDSNKDHTTTSATSEFNFLAFDPARFSSSTRTMTKPKAPLGPYQLFNQDYYAKLRADLIAAAQEQQTNDENRDRGTGISYKDGRPPTTLFLGPIAENSRRVAAAWRNLPVEEKEVCLL